MWPEGKKSVTEITKRPTTAGTAFKNSIIALVENLLTKVRKNYLSHSVIALVQLFKKNKVLFLEFSFESN